jgi:16S rRNA (cytosine967-C5)-methyltransferase
MPSRPATPNARAAAAELLAVWLSRDVFPDRLLDEAAEDRGFVMEMVYGVVRRYRALDAVRARWAEKKPAPPVHAVLLVGLYQLLEMDHVETYAAVHETVAAAKQVGGQRCANFVNAVLRRVAGDVAGARAFLARQPPAVRWSHPDPLVERWQRRYGAEAAEALCRWNNEPPRVALRLNAGRVSLADFRARLRDLGIAASPHPARPHDMLELEAGVPVTRLPGFHQGWVTVQDPSTLLAVDMMEVLPGQRVLDVCSAPGGKTMALAERMGGTGWLLALDADGRRLQRVKENAARLGHTWIEAAAVDLTRGAPDRSDLQPGTFDAVLLDVPCTNTGVLRRRPDARWNFSLDRLHRAVAQQRRILDAAAPYVRPGGRLVYSTCSLEAEENEEQVAAWLAAHPDFRLDVERQLVPPGSLCDGAYAARLCRVGVRDGGV